MESDARNRGNVKSGSRFLQIVHILRKHRVILGVTPEKLRAVLEDLGRPS